MQPTLNRQASDDPRTTELLLVRKLDQYQLPQIHVSDVLAVMRPAVAPSAHNVVVRRVAALAG